MMRGARYGTQGILAEYASNGGTRSDCASGIRVAIAKALQMESEKKDKKHAPMMAQICAL